MLTAEQKEAIGEFIRQLSPELKRVAYEAMRFQFFNFQGRFAAQPSGSVSVQITSTPIIADNPRRLYGLLVNNAAQDVSLSLSANGAILGAGIPLKASGGNFECGLATTNKYCGAICGIGSIATTIQFVEVQLDESFFQPTR